MDASTMIHWSRQDWACAELLCHTVNTLGPPPDLILHLPPPPLPPLLLHELGMSAGINSTCNHCLVDTVPATSQELPSEGMSSTEDVWTYVLISLLCGVMFFVILAVILVLRKNQRKQIRTEIVATAKNGTALKNDYEPVLRSDDEPSDAEVVALKTSRALWAGLRTGQLHYAVEHAQPLRQTLGGQQYSANGSHVYVRASRDNVHLLPLSMNRAPQPSSPHHGASALLNHNSRVDATSRGDEHCYEEPLGTGTQYWHAQPGARQYLHHGSLSMEEGEDQHVYEMPRAHTDRRRGRNNTNQTAAAVASRRKRQRAHGQHSSTVGRRPDFLVNDLY